MKKLLSILLTIVMSICLVNLSNNITKAVKDEFYAVYDTTDDANTLTFYYDTNKGTRTGSVYGDLTTEATKSGDWGYDSIRGDVKNVVIDASVANYKGLKSTAYMFYEMYNATNISGCEYLKVNNVTNMSSMFSEFACDIVNFNVVPNVSNWNTSNVTNMSSMFESYGASSTNIELVPNVSNWNTSNVTDMSSMFLEFAEDTNKKLMPLDLSKWNIDSLISTSNMFCDYASQNIKGDPIIYATDWTSKKTIVGMYCNNMFEDSMLKGNTNGNWDSANTSDTGCFTKKPVIEVPSDSSVDESCEKVIGPTWHWNNELGVCEEYALVRTATR